MTRYSLAATLASVAALVVACSTTPDDSGALLGGWGLDSGSVAPTGVSSVCGVTGAKCKGPSDCCSSDCNSGVCVVDPCAPSGGGCNHGSDCCGGSCTNNVCDQPTCAADNSTCTASTACCSHNCVAGKCEGATCTSNG